MPKELKISFASGRVEVPDLPREDASADEKDKRSLALLAEIGAECEDLEGRVEGEAREVLKRVWALHSMLEAYPKHWIKDFSKRRLRNEVGEKLEALRKRASAQLPEGQGAQVWDDLPYVRDTLNLLFAKQRTSDEVKRLILTPLGSLEFSEIRYQRDSAEDLARVCQEVAEAVKQTAGLDAEALAWGPENRAALLRGQPPEVVPTHLGGSLAPGLSALLVGLLLLGGGGALLAGLAPDLPKEAGLGAAGAGVLALVVGALLFQGATKRRAAAPQRFLELAKRFKERLYLICVLRTLYQISSRSTVASEAYRNHLGKSGGADRWKRIKFEGRDLTELFATESWDPRGTVEHWLAEKVKTTFRLESTHLAAMEDIDDEAWDVILKAYLLESRDQGEVTEAKLLDMVSDLLFTKRGEDVTTERARIFKQIEAAWEQANEREGRSG